MQSQPSSSKTLETAPRPQKSSIRSGLLKMASDQIDRFVERLRKQVPHYPRSGRLDTQAFSLKLPLFLELTDGEMRVERSVLVVLFESHFRVFDLDPLPFPEPLRFGCQLAGVRILHRLIRAAEVDTCFDGKQAHGLRESDALDLHHEVNRVAASIAAFAVPPFAPGTHAEAGRLLGMERAQAHPLGANLLQWLRRAGVGEVEHVGGG